MRLGWLLVRLTIVRCRNRRSDRIKVWPSWKSCLFDPPGVAHKHFSMIVLFVWVQVSWMDKPDREHLHNATDEGRGIPRPSPSDCSPGGGTCGN